MIVLAAEWAVRLLLALALINANVLVRIVLAVARLILAPAVPTCRMAINTNDPWYKRQSVH